MPLLETLEVLEEEAEAKTQTHEEGEIYESSPAYPGCCEHYLFSILLKEPWARHFDKGPIISHQFSSPQEFLSDNGYEIVNSPQNNDIVGYISQRGDFHHWGLFRDGKVISRFGSGPIRRHKIQGTRYGNKAVFFRKQKREAAA